MKARFRIRRGEEEIQARDLEELAELARTGRVGEDDLLHDALTGEWAPARVHPAFQFVLEAEGLAGMDDGEDGREDEGQAPEPPDAASPTEDGDQDLVMELVEEEVPSPEERAQAFIERMEREREEDPERSALGDDVEIFDGRTTVSVTGAVPEEPAPEEELRSPAEDPPRDRLPAAAPSRPASGHRPSPAASDVGAGAGRKGGEGKGGEGGVRRRGPTLTVLALVILALGFAAAVAHPSFRFPSVFPGSDGGEGARAAEPRPAPTDAELRGEAWIDFLDGLDGLRSEFGVDRVPEAWLEGRYLAEASDHGEVDRFWTDYLRYLERARAVEDSVYRQAYLGVLDEAGVDGSVRSLRLARAARDFEAAAGDRRDDYARVWELAVAARELHRVLVDLEGRITWEPATGERLSADPVTEAAGVDEDAQARLEEALDRVLAALQVLPGAGRNVRAQEADWLQRSLRGAAVPDGSRPGADTAEGGGSGSG